MRNLTLFAFLLICCFCNAQKYRYPVFDRTDNYLFHLDSVEVTADSTFLYFTYAAESGAWASISDKTYLQDKFSGKKIRIKSVSGIPFYPNKRHFAYRSKILVKVSCKSIGTTKSFDYIESEGDSTAFNILGIDLLESNNKISSSSNIDYAKTLSSRAELFAQLEDYNKALELEHEAMQILKFYYGKQSIAYAVSMMNMASYSYKIGNLQDAIHYGQEELSLSKMYFGAHHESYAFSLSSLANYYYTNGEFLKAIEFDEQAISIRKRIYGENSNEYSHSLMSLAKDYSGIGDLIKAIDYSERAIIIQEHIANKDELSYLISLNNLASYYSQCNRNQEAISIEKKVVLLGEQLLGKSHSAYLTYLGNLADYESKEGNYKDAIQLASNVICGMEKYGKSNPQYIIALNNLSNIYYSSGDVDSAINNQKICLSLYDDEGFDGNRDLQATILTNLAYYYATQGDFEDAVRYSLRAARLIRDLLNGAIINMSGNQKFLLWQKYNTLFDDAVPYYIANCQNDSLVAELYDLTLFSKGFSTREVEQNVTWRDIQTKLNKEDIAVELIAPAMTFKNQTTLITYALLLDAANVPKLVRLYESELIDQQLSYTENKDSIIGHYLWKPIINESKDVRNIFISPIHVLNSMGFEYFPLENIKNISSKYNIYRLSSTREIIKQTTRKPFINAVLFGDLDYESSGSSYFNHNPINLRSGYDRLPNTKIEISEISHLLEARGVHCSVYSEELGTETVLKNMPMDSIDIIHFATHGGYIPFENVESERIRNNLRFISSTENYEYGPNDEDQILTRSFLLMSKGNQLIHRDIIPEGIDDGFLTSKEITELNLGETKLVVLSACESALGDWAVDGGLMGLQRGFKRAGVQSILMSLKKVDDKATQILMVEFYKNLMNGKSKLQSLLDAQKYLRQVEDGKYDNPKYWASFILLDGLD